MRIRPATPLDVPTILNLIRGIAEYEKLTHQLEATEELLHEALFSDSPAAKALISEDETDGIVGYAIYCYNFSTFLCKRGLYLEDLYIKSEYRKRGYGKALFLEIAKIAEREGCGRMEWTALDWNTPALDFYKSHGADALNEWVLHRFDRKQLEKLAANQ